jgi:TPR repeat protein
LLKSHSPLVDYPKLGERGAKGDKEAVITILRGAQEGDADAQLEAGVLYAKAGDFKSAADWYEQAAQQGVLNAQFNLGVMYYQGQGFDRNLHAALSWFEQAAAQGHANAAKNVIAVRAQIAVLQDEQRLYDAMGVNKVAGFANLVFARQCVDRL